MLRIREIMTRDVLTVSPSTSLQEAAALFAERHVGGAPVVAGGHVVGVVSMSDVLAFAASPPDGHSAMDPDDDDAPPDEGDANEPSARYFTDLWDAAGGEVTERIADVARPSWDLLAAHTVEEVMSRSVLALSSDTSVLLAAATMQAADVHRLLVIDGSVLRGIVTTVDVVRAVAEGRLVRRTFVFGPPRARRIVR
ncbi:MAG: CBS domain-containing protein [Gemmatirosa sp.]|nr:CBS domain-containing protein [Gemmatirosa sp.]